MKNPWDLNYSLLSAHRRLCDQSGRIHRLSLQWAYMSLCLFCRAVAHFFLRKHRNQLSPGLLEIGRVCWWSRRCPWRCHSNHWWRFIRKRQNQNSSHGTETVGYNYICYWWDDSFFWMINFNFLLYKVVFLCYRHPLKNQYWVVLGFRRSSYSNISIRVSKSGLKCRNGSRFKHNNFIFKTTVRIKRQSLIETDTLKSLPVEGVNSVWKT